MVDADKTNPYPIAYDVYGYYLYLPATFIYHDPGLENKNWLAETQKKYKPSPSIYQYTNGKANRQVIIYNIGYSFIYAPGFFIAHHLAPVLGYEADGFSKPYQYSLEFTAFLFTLIGLFMFRKIALHFFSDKITAALILIILAGSNYFFQVTYDGVMPHNILFTVNSLIIWYTIKWHEEKKLKHSILIALLLGLATICRPTELIWVLLPLLWNVYNKTSLVQKLKLFIQYYSHVLISGIILFLVICIQLFYLKYATGYFRAFNLHSERFSFFDPYTIKFLFSYKKGWLVYTPIMIFAVFGFYFLYKLNRSIWLPLFLFFVINLYVVSSWECWWYAASFSQRPMIESYTMMLFPAGYFLTWVNTYKIAWIRSALSIVLTLLIMFNLFQTWQYKNYIIDPERMTGKYYWKIFLKTSIDENTRKYLSIDRGQKFFLENGESINNYIKKNIYQQDFENPVDNIYSVHIIDTMAANCKRSFFYQKSAKNIFEYKTNYFTVTNKSYIWVRASAWVYVKTIPMEKDSCLTVETESRGKITKMSVAHFHDFNILPNKWTKIHLDFLTPPIRHKDDTLKALFKNTSSVAIYIDKLNIDVYEPILDDE